MIQELRQYFAQCPLLSGTDVNVDYLGEDEGSFTIEALPTEPVVKRYYTGGSLRQYCFAISLRKNYGATPSENMENETLCESLAEWVENAQLPILSGNKTAQSITVTSGGYLFDESVNYAGYRISFRLLYTQF